MSPTTLAGRRRRLRDAIATIVVSCLITFVAGVTYIATALDRNNDALCEILVISASPPPRPPELTGPSAPQTKAGEALVEYNKRQSAWQQEFRNKVRSAVDRYDC